jgi:tetratricopeptide (TPR) repeat protein
MPDDELAAVVAALRTGRPVGPLARGFGRDLRCILARAVSVDPGRRYASAGLLRDDLSRLLRHEPVHAHPPSIIYRARKVARRHPGATAGLLAVAVAVTAAVGATGAALQRARAEATRAQTFARFLTHVLSAADPLNPRTGREGDGLRVTDLLDEAVRRLSADPLGDEAAEAEARSAIAASYAGQGEYAESAAQYRRAAELWARVLGPESGPSLQATSALAMVLSLDGKDDEARRLLDRCVERARRSLGDSHPTTVLASTNRAVCLLFAGDFNLVEEESRRLLELLDRAPRRAPEDPQHSMLEGLRGIALIGRGDVTSAEPMLHRAIDGIPRAGQREELVRGLCLCTLGGVEELKGRPKEAEELYREGYETYRQLLGPDDLRTVTREWSLGTALLETGKLPEAQARLRHVAEVMAALLGDGDWRTVRARQDLECAVTLSRPSAPTDAAGVPDTRDPRPPP